MAAAWRPDAHGRGRDLRELTEVLARMQTIQARLPFWVITPELDAAETVAALRTSWLAEAAEGSAHYCVAAGRPDASGAPVTLPASALRCRPTARPSSCCRTTTRTRSARRRRTTRSCAGRCTRCWWRWRRARRGRLRLRLPARLRHGVNVTNLQQPANALPGGDADLHRPLDPRAQPAGGGEDAGMRALAANHGRRARHRRDDAAEPGRRPRPALLARPAAPVQPQLGACAALAEPLGPGSLAAATR